ncbi:ABC transporter ATP-binding protein [Patulibacter sp. NPDC049589]|uniref:ABC transporter ATP-binding protein n=1 Tax=Patulibacter sp. NPDC049589 TaxID=3154731 RepID=UPI003431653C
MSIEIAVRGVHQAFVGKGGEVEVLRDVELHVPAGGFVALLGPSGSGKSTLLRLLAGLDRPRSGTLLADDREITGPDPSRALVFQEATLYPWRSVWRNVAVGPEARGRLKQERGRIDEVIELVGLTGFAEALPHQLSGGMAQRAALARALVNRPGLLLLDEPLGKLDALTRLTLQGEIARLWAHEGFTGLLVTHDVDEALTLADRVVVLSDRPARVLEDVVVDVPRPRPPGDERLVALRTHVLDLLGFRSEHHDPRAAA